LIDRFADGKIAVFAKKIGVNYKTFYPYINRDRSPNAETLAAIRDHLGVNLNWLVTGEGAMTDDAPPPRPKPEPPDHKLLARCIYAVEGALDAAGLELPPPQKAQFIILLYNDQAKNPEDAAEKMAQIFAR